MKRLKFFLRNLERTDTTYSVLYEGALVFPPPPGKIEPEHVFEPTYWEDGISYTYLQTGKLAKDKPTVIVAVPAERLGITRFDVASADALFRAFVPYVDELNDEIYNRARPDKENGKYEILHPGPRVLMRNVSFWREEVPKYYENGSGIRAVETAEKKPPEMYLHLMLWIQLPLGNPKKTLRMLTVMLPAALDAYIRNFDRASFEKKMALADRQAAIRAWLLTSEYCAFVANGSILPRSSDESSPLDGAVPFISTPEDEIEICGISGMGIRRGVTVITGGGYSGKSTLLDAISEGIYDHTAGDGRELVCTDESAVVIAAEDGRHVCNVNISPFLRWMPSGLPESFSTAHASGSTSQAANIMEAVESGSRLLLIDEDRSATNFMIRDERMKALIAKEPITPFTDRVRELWERCGISTVLVIGGSGEYLSVSDRVYLMEDYRISDATERAHALSASAQNGNVPPADWNFSRVLAVRGFTSYPKGSGTERLIISETGFVLIGDEAIDLRALFSLGSVCQMTAVGFMIRYLAIASCGETIDLDDAVDALYEKILREGLDLVYSGFFADCGRFMELPRKTELLAAIRRMRHILFLRKSNIQ